MCVVNYHPYPHYFLMDERAAVVVARGQKVHLKNLHFPASCSYFFVLATSIDFWHCKRRCFIALHRYRRQRHVQRSHFRSHFEAFLALFPSYLHVIAWPCKMKRFVYSYTAGAIGLGSWMPFLTVALQLLSLLWGNGILLLAPDTNWGWLRQLQETTADVKIINSSFDDGTGAEKGGAVHNSFLHRIMNTYLTRNYYFLFQCEGETWRLVIFTHS